MPFFSLCKLREKQIVSESGNYNMKEQIKKEEILFLDLLDIINKEIKKSGLKLN